MSSHLHTQSSSTSPRSSRQHALAAAVAPLLELLETRSHFTVTPNPLANPGGVYTVAEGQSVTISGLASTDAGGTIASYQWDTNYSSSHGFRNKLSGSTWNFTADNSGTRYVALRVVDANGTISPVQYTHIDISDVAPTLTLNLPGSANEASPTNISWSATDPGTNDDVTGWTVHWGDGHATNYTGDASAGTHTYDADGIYAVTLTATQDDAVTSITQNLTVNEVTPVVSLTTPASTIDEGGNATVNFISTNRANSISGWTIDWGDGSGSDVFGASASTATHQYVDSGNYTATVSADEPDGGQGSATKGFTVRNVAPVVTQTGVPTTGVEGTAITLGSTVTDAGVNDTQTYGWTVYKDGSHFTLPGGTTLTGSNFTFTPTDNGSYVVRLTVADNGGAMTTINSSPIVVSNVAPTATVSGEPGSSINEGAAVSLLATPADAGSDDTFTYNWSVTKNGSAFALPNGANTTSAGFTFTPTDNGSYVATVVVSDDDGATVSVNSQAIVATNVAPTASITGNPSTGNEGSAISVAANPHDAGSADTFSYAWSVTKDGQAYILPNGNDASSHNFSFVPTDNGSYVIGLTVTDDDGASVSVTGAAIAVANVAPTAAITGNSSGVEGAALNYTAAVTDPGTSDTATYLWTVTKNGANYGLNGATVTASTFAFTPDDDGAYVVSVAVTDNDGDSSTMTHNVTVTNATPTAAITGTPAGGFEGSAVTVGSTVTDAGVHDTFSYAWTVAKDGHAVDLTNVTTTGTGFTFTPADNGNYVVSLAVTDNGGAVRTVSSSAIVVANVNPTGVVSGEPNGSANEGSTLNLTATAADVGVNDTFSYAWTITKDGQTYTPASGTVVNAATLSFVPNDNGSYIATVAITDNDGGHVTAASQAITVVNVAPVAAITSAPASSPEGTAVTVGSTVTDAGTADTQTYAWSVTKDGNPVTLPGGTATTAASFTFTPRDNGAYVVSLTATDDDNGSVTTTANITVTNVAPAATITGSSTVAEDHAITLGTTVTDAGLDDTKTYVWSVTKDGASYTTNLGATNAAGFTFTPNLFGSYVVSCAVTDNDGGTTTATKTITVTNVAPTGVSISGVPSGPRSEGTTITLHGHGTDVSGENDLTYAWSVTRNGGQTFAVTDVPTDEADFDFTPTDNGSYVVSFAVTDSGGLTTSASTTAITITNAIPSAGLSGAPGTAINEGTPVNLTVSAADPGDEDTLTYAWSVTKDGQAFTLPNGTNATGTAFTFTPTDNGTYIARCVVTDDDGGAASVSTAAITVNNVAATAAIAGAPTTGNEGTAIALTGSATDPGSADVLTYSWSVTKNGSSYVAATTPSASGQAFSFTPTDNGTYVATLVVNDGTANTTISTSAVTINNVAPTGSISGPTTSDEGSAITLTTAATDAGSLDTLSYAWSVTKDGQSVTLPGGTVANTAAFTYTPTNQGAYVFICTVSDNDGASTVLTQNVAVANVLPTVAITGTPATGNEGSAITVGSTATDPGADSLTYGWSVYRNGSVVTLPGGTAVTGTGLTFTPTDNGSYVVRLAVTDDTGATTVNSTAIVVANVAPVVAVTGNTTGFEGTAAGFGSTVTDVSTADTTAGFTYAWSVIKNGQAFTLPNGTLTDGVGFAFTPTNDGTYVAQVVVADKDGGTSTQSASIVVANVAPTATINGTPGSAVNEGSTVNLAANAADVGAADVLTYSWSVTKDGQAFALPSNLNVTGGAFSFVPTDNGSYVATVSVNDGLATTTVSTTAITVNNVAPTGTISGSATGSEGTALTLTANAADAGALDTLTYAWTVTKDGQAVTLPGSVAVDAAALTFTPADNGAYVATCVVTDKDNGTVTLTKNVAVANVDPTAAQANAPTTGTEGSAITVNSTASDPGDDTLTYGWTVYRNGEHLVLADDVAVDGQSLTFTPDDNGSYVVRLSVSDEDGGITTVNSSPIVVANAAPTAAVTGDSSVDEGEEADFTSTVTDVSGTDTDAGFTYAWTAKRGNITVDSGTDVDFSFTPPVHGTYTVTLVATDKDGSTSTSSTTLTAANVAPTDVAIDGDLDGVIEGDSVSLLASADDVSGDTVSYAWQVRSGENVFASGTGADIDFTAARGNYTVSVTATDSAGAHDSDQVNLSVGNVAPTATITGPTASVLLGSPATFGLNIGDVPVSQSMHVSWDYGDGSGAANDFVGTQSLVKKHTYAAAGTYTVTATVSDGVDQTIVTQTVNVGSATMMADPMDPAKTALYVIGGDADDNIAVTQQANRRYSVTVNGQSQGTGFAPTGRIYVYGNGGSNTINVTGNNAAVVFAGSNASNVTTGAGNDIVIGSTGADKINGGGGRDILVGMAGVDVLHGNDGDDLLIAGTLNRTDTGTLNTVMNTWGNGGLTTAARRTTISSLFSKKQLITADTGGNQLFGEAGNDWMIFNASADRLKDLQKTDLTN